MGSETGTAGPMDGGGGSEASVPTGTGNRVCNDGRVNLQDTIFDSSDSVHIF